MAWRSAEMNRVAIRSDRCDVQILMRSFTSILSRNSIQSLIATTRFSTSPNCIQAPMCVEEVITSADQRQRINWRWSCIAMGHLWFAHPNNLFGLCSHLWLNFLGRSASTKETSSCWHSGRRKESQMRTSSRWNDQWSWETDEGRYDALSSWCWVQDQSIDAVVYFWPTSQSSLSSDDKLQRVFCLHQLPDERLVILVSIGRWTKGECFIVRILLFDEICNFIDQFQFIDNIFFA